MDFHPECIRSQQDLKLTEANKLTYMRSELAATQNGVAIFLGKKLDGDTANFPGCQTSCSATTEFPVSGDPNRVGQSSSFECYCSEVLLCRLFALVACHRWLVCMEVIPFFKSKVKVHRAGSVRHGEYAGSYMGISKFC